jgi:hypothetical protein
MCGKVNNLSHATRFESLAQTSYLRIQHFMKSVHEAFINIRLNLTCPSLHLLKLAGSGMFSILGAF